MIPLRATLAAWFIAAATLPAHAAAPDCSTMKAPDTPVKGMVRGHPFVVNEATIHATPDGMQINADKFDSYELSIQTDGIFNAMSVHFLVRAGTKPDGKTFRVLPTDSISVQPAAAEGTPEVQGWDLALESADVDTSFTETIASLRLEIGKRSGNMVPGRIYFCVPSIDATIAGAFSARVIP